MSDGQAGDIPKQWRQCLRFVQRGYDDAERGRVPVPSGMSLRRVARPLRNHQCGASFKVQS